MMCASGHCVVSDEVCSIDARHDDHESRCCNCGVTLWSPRVAATGHEYVGPGYCRTCGVAERLHTTTVVAS